MSTPPPPRRAPVVALLPSPAAPSDALAHAGGEHQKAPVGPRDWGELWRTWGLEPGVVIPLVLSAMVYAQGIRALWRGGHAGRGVRTREAWCFAGGWLTLVMALVSPLHPWGSVLFSAHMTQHELLMLVAAPLLVLGKPIVAALNGLPPGWGRSMAGLARVDWWRRAWKIPTNPLAAWAIHAAVLWLWHVPALFQATIDNELVHAIQHLSFLLSALLFWWAVLQGRYRATGYGVAVLYMFTTAFHSGLLGALIALARSVWYPAYRGKTESWGLTALEDQQLGGLIMWVPACTVYLVAGLALFAGWLRESERRARDREGRSSISAAGRPVS
jgi:putative membrane protein